MHLDKNITSPQDGYVMLLFNGVSQEFSHKKTEEYFLIWLCCNAIENSTWYRFCFSRLQVPLTNLDVSTHKVNSQFRVFDNILQPQQLTPILPSTSFPQSPPFTLQITPIPSRSIARKALRFSYLSSSEK